ncbi:MAG TPA: response regulator transcription factor [Thermoleophilaceae bacterium]
MLCSEPWVDRLISAHSSAEALQVARRYRPHVAVIDTQLVWESGDLCHELRGQSPSTRILLTSGERVSEVNAKSLGAVGVVPKTWHGRAIAAAARSVGFGRTVFAAGPEQQTDLLTPREKTILEMLARGATSRAIATRLNLSPHTVKDHVRSVLRKLKARNRAEAVLRARRLGVLT